MGGELKGPLVALDGTTSEAAQEHSPTGLAPEPEIGRDRRLPRQSDRQLQTFTRPCSLGGQSATSANRSISQLPLRSD